MIHFYPTHTQHVVCLRKSPACEQKKKTALICDKEFKAVQQRRSVKHFYQQSCDFLEVVCLADWLKMGVFQKPHQKVESLLLAAIL